MRTVWGAVVSVASMGCGLVSGVMAQSGAVLTSEGISADAPRKSVTEHHIQINGRKLVYTAIVADDIIPAADGEPGAAIVTTAYVVKGANGRRPVMFLFNGGPGASSSPLHMSALGPVRRLAGVASDRSASSMVDNVDSPLDTADLVFVDPVSTGFSRALPGVDPKQWYNGKGDALEVCRVIDDWLDANHRTSSPRFLAGESYGTTRASLILKYCPQLHFSGVLLISGGERTAAGPDAPFIESVPPMAAGAYFHRKVDRNGRSLEQFVAQARQFASGDYADALAKGQSLSPADRHHVADQLASFIGLPDTFVEAHDLRISTNDYMFNLLQDHGLRTGLLDVRSTSPLMKNASGAIDDPALGVVTPAANSNKAPTPEEVGAVSSPGVAQYLRDQLKFPSQDPYIGVNFTANVAWTWDNDRDTSALVAQRMRSDSGMRLFVASGLFDLATTGDGSGFTHAGVPAGRLTFVSLPGGHEVYGDDATHARFGAAVRSFLRATP
jgi:carboxypeptidase C (cathepsin A)